MRNASRIVVPSLLLALASAIVLAACKSTPPPPQPIEAINNSEVYRLAQEALQPIADQFIERGDRILLANVPAFNGSDSWRFVPTPIEVKQDDFEGIIKPNAQKRFKAGADRSSGTAPELILLNDIFSFDGAKGVYRLRTTGDKFDELLLGRTLAGAGYSGLGSFTLPAFARLNPYFIDSFESGLLSAVLRKQGKGFERLRSAGTETSQKTLADHREGRLVFNTNMLGYNSWAEIQEGYKPNGISKLLVYSINNVLSSGTEYIGIQVSFRLIDVTRGGKLLWSGSKSLTSAAFPRDKLPWLGTLRLSIPTQAIGAQKDAMLRSLRDQGIRTMSAVLVKIDDIPVFGSYPVTREDFAVESALEGFFSSFQLSATQSVAIADKLYPRRYKEAWQLAHAVHYINPLLGGDYGQFRNYYGAQYMIGYRVLWKKIQGIQLLQGDKDLELGGKILGIYLKIMDMADNGRVILSSFLSLGTEAELDQNILYRCYARTKSLAGLPDALRGTGVVTDGTHSSLINRRMEIANNYIGEKGPSEDFILNRLPDGKDQASLMMAYHDAYEILRAFGAKTEEPAPAQRKGLFSKTVSPAPAPATAPMEETWTPAQELNMTIGINLMQTWFEDGLCSALVAGDAAPNEKLESLYSRYLLQKSVELAAEDAKDNPDVMPWLSPLQLAKWGSSAPLKSYYGIDKIIYFSLLETGTPVGAFVKPPSGSAISRFFPLVSADPNSLQVSVVNLVSGDYEFKQDFALK